MVDLKNRVPYLNILADVLSATATYINSLKETIKHWYYCEGGKYYVDCYYAIKEVGISIAICVALIVAAPYTGGVAVFAAIGQGIGIVNSLTNLFTSIEAIHAVNSGDPAWAVIYSRRDRLSDVLREVNFGDGTLNRLSYVGATTIEVTELVCDIVMLGYGISNSLTRISSKLKTLGYLRRINVNGINQLVPINNPSGMIPYNQPGGGMVPYVFGYGDRYLGGGGIARIIKDDVSLIKKYLDSGVKANEGTGKTTAADWIGNTSKLAKSSPVEIPSNAVVKVQNKANGYDMISYKWSDGTYTYNARWHTPTSNAPAGSGNSWVIERVTPGTPTGQIRVEHVYTPGVNGNWTPMWEWKAAVDAYNKGTTTAIQDTILKVGHVDAP